MSATRTIAAGLLDVALTLVLFQRSVLSAARAENRALRSQQATAREAAPGDPGPEGARADIEELERLRAQTRDLHRLRNEIRVLREQKTDLEKLRADNRSLRSQAENAVPAGPRPPEARPLVAKESLANAGLNSPEAALQTFLWAMRERDARRIRACFVDEAGHMRDQSDEEVLAGSGGMMDTFKGFQIIARKDVSADEVKLGVRMVTRDDAAPTEIALPFKRLGNDWKLNIDPH